MTNKKSFWTSITGGLTSAAPVLLSCCKSGACIGVCASPVASLFGVSSAAFASSPWVMALEPVLIAVSAVSFTVSYYTLYKLPKLAACNTPASCDCAPDAKATRSISIQKWIFWLGLILSIGFLTYFEVSKYQAANAPVECGTEGCTTGSAECSSGGEEESCTTSCDSTSTSACCIESNSSEKGSEANAEQSTITCAKCGHKKLETMPTEVCQLSYTCEMCRAVLHPKDGDCCVFCTYGDHKCPSKQTSGVDTKNNNQPLVCKLTSPELQKRKETVIASLKKQIVKKQELSNGYAFKFAGTDKVIDELSEFVKSERSCCGFFNFGLSFSGDGKEAWLNLTGPEGAKDMINTELGL